MSGDMHVERVDEWIGQEVVDRDGEKVGKLEEVFFDLDTQTPTVGAVKSGLLGRKVHLVPLAGASLGREHVRIDFPAEAVKDAPAPGENGELTRADEEALFGHYGVSAPTGAATADGVRYESGSARTARYEAADAAHRRAEELEALADERERDVHELERQAREAEGAAERARGEADRARQDAEAARAEAERLGD